ncbi:hypothetical protein KC343_g2263 [Hortaea werneckii]|uniref:LysM domain-containing protein n=1 Tax=Hortaea werneckii TaxID=91943 RepID=A0A3M7GVR3_HORWE|nr:hypothetical protein KC323_g3744 [Hortaea werneckii]KAI6869429.1 hypothetical protein KC338_g3460 [Hortaea werneckii]KAI7186305.1 hypothetical protein KC352_g22447 [Hortaea werneckii]KAI7570368.1 hypothetical protein KC317_g2521 [Hortaea werneckii]KAI7622435.1 hypothetical protein KC346_g3215 [Hortaea werneckii]
MFTKTSIITLAATAAFITTASARPAGTSPAVEPTITAKPENDVYADADDTEYCTTDGVEYPCAWATAGVPDFKSLVARDEEEATSITTSAAVPEASGAVESDLSNIDQEPEDDPKLVDEDDDEEDEYGEDDGDEYEDSEPDLSIPAAILNTNSTLLNPRGSAGNVKYCSAPGICATLPVKEDDCTTFEKGYTSLTFSAGLECSIYAKQDCRKQLFVSKGKVGNVKGFIDTTTDPRAKKHKVGSVMSFKCY